MLESLWYDLKFAARLLRRSPRNSMLAMAILALGIGANTAMFSAISYVLIRPLPFRDADHLLRLQDAVVGSDGLVHPFNMSGRTMLALRSAAPVFEAVAGFSSDSMTLTGTDVPERLSIVLETAGADRALGVSPALGRAFSSDEERAGRAGASAIVSDAFARSHFGAPPTAIGRTLRLDDRAFTIVGVMPPQYAFPYDAQVWLPFTLDAADTHHDFAVFARRAPGATAAQVQAALATVAADVRRQYADVLPTYRIQATPMRESLVGSDDAPLLALSEVVGLLLLIAAVNVATLLLARSVTRRREFAMRAILGATRARHLRQLVVESLLLGIGGGAAGLLLVAWLGRLTATLMPSVLSGQLGLSTPAIDWRVLAFATMVSLASALVAGLVPAFGSWRGDAARVLAEGGRTATMGRTARRLLGALVVVETALTLVLLVGSGLVIRNFARLATAPLGFEAHNLLAIELTPPAAYAPGLPRVTLIHRALDEIRSQPGVVNAAVTTVNPLGGGTWSAPIIAQGGGDAALNVNDRLVTAGLVETMRIRILRGRSFSDRDDGRAPQVVIVSERLARTLWPGADALGQRLRIARSGSPWLTVIGVAADVRDARDPGEPRETMYRPLEQNAASAETDHVYFMVRTAADPLTAVSVVEHAIGRADKTLAPYAPQAMDQYAAQTLSRERVSAAFMLAFGAFGLLLATLGIYGVMAFSVAQRSAEFAIRMALGATRREIVPLALGRGAALIAGGVAAGAVGALLLNRVLSAVLSDVGSLEPGVLAAGVFVLLSAGLVASLLPSMRASRLDPAQALKNE